MPFLGTQYPLTSPDNVGGIELRDESGNVFPVVAGAAGSQASAGVPDATTPQLGTLKNLVVYATTAGGGVGVVVPTGLRGAARPRGGPLRRGRRARQHREHRQLVPRHRAHQEPRRPVGRWRHRDPRRRRRRRPDGGGDVHPVVDRRGLPEPHVHRLRGRQRGRLGRASFASSRTDGPPVPSIGQAIPWLALGFHLQRVRRQRAAARAPEPRRRLAKYLRTAAGAGRVRGAARAGGAAHGAAAAGGRGAQVERRGQAGAAGGAAHHGARAAGGDGTIAGDNRAPDGRAGEGLDRREPRGDARAARQARRAAARAARRGEEEAPQSDGRTNRLRAAFARSSGFRPDELWPEWHWEPTGAKGACSESRGFVQRSDSDWVHWYVGPDCAWSYNHHYGTGFDLKRSLHQASQLVSNAAAAAGQAVHVATQPFAAAVDAADEVLGHELDQVAGALPPGLGRELVEGVKDASHFLANVTHAAVTLSPEQVPWQTIADTLEAATSVVPVLGTAVADVIATGEVLIDALKAGSPMEAALRAAYDYAMASIPGAAALRPILDPVVDMLIRIAAGGEPVKAAVLQRGARPGPRGPGPQRRGEPGGDRGLAPGARVDWFVMPPFRTPPELRARLPRPRRGVLRRTRRRRHRARAARPPGIAPGGGGSPSPQESRPPGPGVARCRGAREGRRLLDGGPRALDEDRGQRTDQSAPALARASAPRVTPPRQLAVTVNIDANGYAGIMSLSARGQQRRHPPERGPARYLHQVRAGGARLRGRQSSRTRQGVPHARRALATATRER